MIRLRLLTPGGLIVSPVTYNRLFTLHGVVMVWFFLVPALPVTLGNFVIQLMLGARDLALPRLNLLRWYLFITGGLVALGALFIGGLDTGWTFYTPLSTAYSHGAVVIAAVGIFISGFSSIATGVHGLHVLAGRGLLGWLAWRTRRGAFDAGWITPVEVVGLYWSFVDFVWLVLFPLIYLIGRAG